MQDFQHEQLFTDLTSEEAAVVEGGALVLNTSVDFDTLLYSRSFKNNVGSKIEADLSTRGTGASNPSNTSYNVTLQRLTGGRYQDIRSATAPINGSKNIVWSGLGTGDTLRLRFDDQKDGKRIVGSLKVYD